MIKRLSPFFKELKQFGANLTIRNQFSTANEERLNIIRNHKPLTEYKNLNYKVKEHTINTTRIIKDQQTKLTFLIEEGGFPGCSDIGVCIRLGTQDEQPQNAGSLQYLKSYVHMKPTFEEMVDNYQFLHKTGATFDFNYDVLSTYAKGSFFYEDSNVMVDLLLDLAIQQKNMFQDNFETTSQLSNINELVRRTGFADRGIGMPSSGIGNVLQNKQFLQFQKKITPHNMLISMSNIPDPQALIKTIKSKIKSKYQSFLQRKAPAQTKSTYVGGLRKFKSDQQFFDFAIAFPSVEFRSQKMELYNILRVLLGNASSFSSGGPGKGMHSRCTKNLLNRVPCVERCSFINQHFDETGLFGLTVGGPHHLASEVIQCTLEEFKRLRHLIPQAQLDRVKNILVASIYTNIERQSDRLQEMSKHIYSYGRVRLHEFEPKIREVTAKQIQQEIQRLFNQKPTFVLSGNEQSLKKQYDFQELSKKLKSK